MKRNNKILDIVNILLVITLISTFIYAISMDKKVYTKFINNEHLITYLKSNYLEIRTVIEEEKLEKLEEIEELEKVEKSEEIDKKDNKDESNKKDTQVEIPKQKSSTNKEVSIPKEEKIEIKKEPVKENIKEEQQIIKLEEKVIEKLVGSLAGYGPDCAGCTSFKTASGRYIGEGKIYYEDKEFGKLRILAGDKSYPFGTVVKMTNTKYADNSPIYGVVLDRGGGVGKDKTFLFDLLFETEKQASQAGSRKNVTFEILRLGY